MEAGVRTGGCLCGAVRYSVRGDPVHVGCCHCADCRKESGGAFIVYGHWPVEAFEVSGEISSYGGRGFCPLCGSRLLDPVRPGDKFIEIRLGSLDEAPFELKPEAEVWVKRRESWLLPVEGQRNTSWDGGNRTKIVPSALGSIPKHWAQRSVLAPQPMSALQTPRNDEYPKTPISCRRLLSPTG